MLRWRFMPFLHFKQDADAALETDAFLHQSPIEFLWSVTAK
jgi:hypothetical protein